MTEETISDDVGGSLSPAKDLPSNHVDSKKQTEKKTKKKIPEEFVERRERSSRGAKTKAALQISLNSIKETSSSYEAYTDVNGEETKRAGRPKKVKQDEILSSSPLKFKAGPRCTKVAQVKPGPRRKRGRNFHYEDLHLDHLTLDEMPVKSSYEKKFRAKFAKAKKEVAKEKLKVLVPVLDLKNSRDPCTKAAYEIGLEQFQTAKLKSANNLVTAVTYQKGRGNNTFQHRPDPNRVLINDSKARVNLSSAQPFTISTGIDPKAQLQAKLPSLTQSILRPPPVTNYMSVKIETLMNCLEKMYHHHLPMNAFTSRFPNARAKAMLTLMLDGHRQDCQDCANILEDANVGIFHCDEEKFKMDLAAYGPAIPSSAPVVDLSQYPDNIAEMKKLLMEKDAKIKALEKRLESVNKDVKPDEVDKLDLVEMLDGVSEPTMDKYGGKFLKTAGYRLVDLRLLRMALEICQNCHHNKMTLAEMSPEVEGNQEDIVTRLAFVCTVCGPKAIFPTSPFSKTYPTNYSLNKLLLPLIGPSAYFHLAQFVQQNPDAATEVVTTGAFSQQKPQLLVSVDHAFFDFARPFDPPLPTDPDANLMLTGRLIKIPGFSG